MNYKWVLLTDKEEAIAATEKYKEENHLDFADAADYDKAGWYLVYTHKERCPRGCCYDYTAEIKPAVKVVEEVQYEMRELTDRLREAKSKL